MIMRKHKSCGNCANYWKRKNDMWFKGLCEFYDIQSSADNGHDCEGWEGIKYKRNKHERKT